jgi:hypothetical protein
MPKTWQNDGSVEQVLTTEPHAMNVLFLWNTMQVATGAALQPTLISVIGLLWQRYCGLENSILLLVGDY